MTATVKTVTEKISTKGDKNAILTMEDGRQIWTPEYGKALMLLGKEIPTDWYQDEGQYGPRAFPPREKGQAKGGGGGYRAKESWYNSEAGVQFTQERMDRRTALMQAVETYGSRPPNMRLDQYIEAAELFYDWLRESSPAVPASGKGGVAEKVGTGEQTNSPVPATITPESTVTADYPVDWPSDERR